ncbi:MAG: hypothetical protein WCG42_04430 [Parachlamydiaceae bacterium]
MIRFFLIFLFSFQTFLVAEKFTVDMSLSGEELTIDQDLIVKAILTFPDTYHPNIPQMRSNLLAYYGFGVSSFSFVKSESSPIEKIDGGNSQKVNFVLSPRRSGRHFLSFKFVRFDPNSSGKSVDIPSDILMIDITIPKTPFILQNVISPPMPLSRNFPVDLSERNRRKYIQNPVILNSQKEEMLSYLAGRKFPWLTLLSLFIIVLVIILVRLSPDDDLISKEEALSSEKERALATERLRSLVLATPKAEESASAFFLRLQGGLRNYIDSAYHIGVTTSTFQEIADKKIPLFTEDINIPLMEVFREAEDVKFARKEASKKDCDTVLEVINKILQI